MVVSPDPSKAAIGLASSESTREAETLLGMESQDSALVGRVRIRSVVVESIELPLLEELEYSVETELGEEVVET